MIQKISDKPVGDGELARESNHQGKPCIFDLKKITQYCNAEYCLSCAYFQQTKGNFGRCTVLKNDKKYDGSKKGSGCRVWRLNKELIDLVYLVPNKQNGNGWIQKLREEFNQERKAERTRLKENKIIEKRFENRSQFTKINTDHIQQLPYAQTSDVHSFKRTYYRKKYNHRIIEFVIKLIKENKSLSSRQIANEVQKQFNKKINHKTIINWSQQFKLDKKWEQKNASHRYEIRQNISKGVKQYFDTQKKISPLPHIKEKILQLFFTEYSIRQISKTIQKDDGFKFTIKKVYETLQEEIKELPEFNSSCWYKTKYHLLPPMPITSHMKNENQK